MPLDMHSAAREGNVEDLRAAISTGEDVNSLDYVRYLVPFVHD